MANLEKDVEDLKVSTAELRSIVRDIALAQLRTENELREFKDYVLTSQANWERRFEQSELQRKQELQDHERKIAQDLQAHREKLDAEMKAFEARLLKEREENEKAREQRMREFEEQLLKEREESDKKRQEDLQAHREKLDAEMKAFEAKLLKEREENEKAREQRMREFEAKLRKDNEEYEKKREQDRQEWKREKREMNKKWGELANKMGTLVEDIVAPNIRRLAEEVFDVGDMVDFSVRRFVTHSQDKSRFKDFDALFIGSRGIILNETKSTVRQSYIDEFIAFIPTVFEYLPEHRGKKVIPVFSSLHIPEHFVNYLTKHKIYALAMGDETMEILNYHDIPKP